MRTAAPMTVDSPTSPLLASTKTAATGSSAAPATYPYATMPGPFGATASLYVGELHVDVTEAMLFELFSQVGPVASIRVCRDAVTRRSLGYAYVNFHNSLDAERALDTLNYTPLKGQAIRIMWSQRDPSVRRSGAGNIFIKDLDKTIDNKTLHDTFSAFGNILSCKVVCDEHGNSRGYGFVHFETAEAADQAIAKVNGMLLNDKKVYVGHHIPRRERQSKAEEARARFTNVFIKNLDESVDDEDFVKMFEKFGKITSSVLQKDQNGKSRGFGFVNFEKHEEAQNAVDELNGKDIKGKQLFAGRAQKKSEREEELRRQYEQAKMERISKYQGVNCYVKNLDEQVDENKLKEEFSIVGSVSSCKIMVDDKGISRGFGFVCFTIPEDANKAVTEMNGRLIVGKPVYVALAQRKDVRRSQLEAQFAQRAQLRMQQMGPGSMYGAGPIFYPPPGTIAGRPTPAFAYPQQMMARPRWMPPQQQGGPRPSVGYNPQIGSYGMMQMRPGARPPRQPRGAYPFQMGRPNGMQNGATFLPNASIPGQRRPGFPRYGNYRGRQEQGMMMGGSIPGLTAAALAAANPEEQKQMLGERLYPLVQAQEPELAGKITGMLLEMDNSELLHFLESPDALTAKVSEAVAVLQHHLANQQSSASSESGVALPAQA